MQTQAKKYTADKTLFFQHAMEGVYTTLRQRRATVTGCPEDSKVGDLVHIESFLPVAESFGFHTKHKNMYWK